MKRELNTPILFRPPDVILGQPVTKAVDSWSMGITIAHILGCRKLFDDFWPDEDTLILESIDTLGPLPTEMWQAWTKRSKHFKNDGSSVQDEKAPPEATSNRPQYINADGSIWSPTEASGPLAARLRENMGTNSKSMRYGHSPAELQSLETLLRALLQYEPEKRMTVDQALKSEWVQHYGIPALQACLPDLDLSYLG